MGCLADDRLFPFDLYNRNLFLSKAVHLNSGRIFEEPVRSAQRMSKTKKKTPKLKRLIVDIDHFIFKDPSYFSTEQHLVILNIVDHKD